jgi:hypothetical protein
MSSIDYQTTSSSEAANAFCRSTIEGFRKKADHNKNEALYSFMIVISTTLCAPLFITLASGFFWGKVVPSILSLLAAGATAWLQLRKPQQLWSLYRGAQRELEDQETKYIFGLDQYDSSDRDKLLAERVATIALNVHYQWLPLVPNPEQLKLSSDKASIKEPIQPKSHNHV